MSNPADQLTLWETFTEPPEFEVLRQEIARVSRSPLIVIGQAGIGKTSLLRMYEQRHGGDHAAVVHIHAGDLSDVRSLPAIIAARLGGAVGERILRSRRRTRVEGSSVPIEEVLAQVSARRPILVVIDDVEQLPSTHIGYLLDYAARAPERTRFVLLGRAEPGHAQKSSSRVLMLRPLSLAATADLLRKRLAQARQNPAIADAIISGLRQSPVDFSRITPRFVLRLTNHYLRGDDFAVALSNTLLEEFRNPATLLISADVGRARVIPVADLEPTEIVTPTAKIITATPLIIVPTYAAFWRQRLDRLEQLISTKSVREAELQEFFEDNELLLRGIDYARVVPHPILERDDDGDLIPDFFLKPHNSDLVDILDLKLPTKKIITGQDDRKRLTAAVTEAIAQVREYRAYFESAKYRHRVRERYGVTGYRPSTMIVIGRSAIDLSTDQSRRVFDELPHYTRLVTYDDLLARMRAYVWGQAV